MTDDGRCRHSWAACGEHPRRETLLPGVCTEEEPRRARALQSREAPTIGRAPACSGQCRCRACAAPCASRPDMEIQGSACSVTGSACRPPVPPHRCHGERVPRGPAVTTPCDRQPVWQGEGVGAGSAHRPAAACRRRAVPTGGMAGGKCMAAMATTLPGCRECASHHHCAGALCTDVDSGGGDGGFLPARRRVTVTHGSDGASRKRLFLVARRTWIGAAS